MKKTTVKQVKNIRIEKACSLSEAKRIADSRNLKNAIKQLVIDDDLKDIFLAFLDYIK